MKHLSPQSFSQAREFLKTHGRALDCARFEHAFEGGSREAVFQALSRYQNEDGGFGHAIEPDFRLPASSPMATTLGLAVLRDLGASSGETMVANAIRYLLASYDPAKGYWPSIHPQVNEYPHAPWWDFDAQTHKVSVETAANPGAEIVGYLHAWRDLVPQDFLERVTGSTLAYLESKAPALEMHDLICLVRLAAELPEPLLRQKMSVYEQALDAVVARDAQAWASYGPQPLMYVDSPASPFASLLREALEKNLDYVIETQSADGNWSPNWTWGDNYPEAWEEAKRDWQSALTFDNLRRLQAFGRIPDASR